MVPSGRAVRPTLNRIRESLFSILGDTVRGAVVLDAFAGTGALGIEALSRGAKSALFCDENPDCIRVVRENLAGCGLAEKAVVLRAKVPEGLSKVRGVMGESCDLVFLDPPYGGTAKERLLEEFRGLDFLRERARIVFEHARKDIFSFVPEGFVVENERKYGDTLLTFLNYQPGEERDDGR